MTRTMKTHDVIDSLAGISADSPLGRVRDERREARDNAQASYRALFEPEDPGSVTPTERFALALFVAGLHGQPATEAFYREHLAALAPSAGLLEALDAEIARGRAQGPYGSFPPGPLSAEDRPGPVYRVDLASRPALGARLPAALDHAHLLVFRPRDASPEALRSLLEAGWSTADIVTLSQLVAFLSFQIRTVAGLRVLDGRA